MRNRSLAIALALAVAMPSASNAADGDTDNESADAAKRLQTQTRDALNALADYSTQQTEKANATARELVDRLDQRIESLRADLDANWDQMSEATREEHQAAIDALASKRDELNKQFQALSERSGEAWRDLKSGFVGSYGALTADEPTGDDANTKTSN